MPIFEYCCNERKALRTAFCLTACALVLQATLGPHLLHAVFGCSAGECHAARHAWDHQGALRSTAEPNGAYAHLRLCLACILAKSFKGTVIPAPHVAQADSPDQPATDSPPFSLSASLPPLPVGPRAPPYQSLPSSAT